MKKVLSGILIAFVMMSVSDALVYAGGHSGGSKCGSCAYKEGKCKIKKLKKKMSMYWAYRDELKLTEDQLGQIADIKHAAMKQMIVEGAEAKVVKVDIKTELWAPQIDAEKVMPLIDEKYAAKAKVAKTMVKALADAQAVLTEEQRQQMKEIKVDKYLQKSGARSDCTGKHCPLTGK